MSSSVQHTARKATPTATTSSMSSNQQTTQRLQQELMSFMTAQDDTCSAFPSGDSLYHWVGTIKGADDTPYEGLTYRLSLAFGPEYPFKAPTVKFDTGCYHPNVDPAGNICLDILKVRRMLYVGLWSLSPSLSPRCTLTHSLTRTHVPRRKSGRLHTASRAFCSRFRAFSGTQIATRR